MLTSIPKGVDPGEDIGEFVGTEPEDIAWFQFGRTALSRFPIEQEVFVPISVAELSEAGINLDSPDKIYIRPIVNLMAKDRGDVQPQKIKPVKASERDMQYLKELRARKRGE